MKGEMRHHAETKLSGVAYYLIVFGNHCFMKRTGGGASIYNIFRIVIVIRKLSLPDQLLFQLLPCKEYSTLYCSDFQVKRFGDLPVFKSLVVHTKR